MAILLPSDYMGHLLIQQVGGRVDTLPYCRWFGFIHYVCIARMDYCKFSDYSSQLSFLNRFKRLSGISLRGSLARGDVVRHLDKTNTVSLLDLGETNTSNNCVKVVAQQCRALKDLFLDSTLVTSAVIDHILEMDSLLSVCLASTDVTTSDVVRLVNEHTSLKYVYLSTSQCSSTVAKDINARNPSGISVLVESS